MGDFASKALEIYAEGKEIFMDFVARVYIAPAVTDASVAPSGLLVALVIRGV